MAGGGSGGHLYPGVAVAEALVRIAPHLKPLFLCTQRDIDRTILGSTGFEFITQPIVPPRRSVGGLLKFWRAWRQTQDTVKEVLKDRRPAAALGLGGYAAGLAVKLSSKAKLPTAILNPDVIPGKANQYLLPQVQKVFCQFEATAEHVVAAHRPKLVTTGCPIRSDILASVPREEAARRLGLDPMLQTLVITGASQGAVTVNAAVLESLKRIVGTTGQSEGLQGWQVLHLSGKDNGDAVRSEYRALPIRATVLEFTSAMADVWAVADLAVSRSGASSCAELIARGVPAILMPYPYHKDQHQLANARALADRGAATIVDDLRDRSKNADALRPVLEGLLYDLPKRQAMQIAAVAMSQGDAAELVARAIVEMIRAS